MKIKYFITLAALAIAPIAHSDGYSGVKVGPMLVDLGGADHPVNGGFVFGTSRSGLSFEGEASFSVSKGYVYVPFSGGYDVSITTMAGYAAFRAESDTYLKTKFGLLYEDVNIGPASGNDTGLSYGLGVGWRLDSGNMVELEYTIVEQDVNFLSLSVLF